MHNKLNMKTRECKSQLRLSTFGSHKYFSRPQIKSILNFKHTHTISIVATFMKPQSRKASAPARTQKIKVNMTKKKAEEK